jgi:hypothetical protein
MNERDLTVGLSASLSSCTRSQPPAGFSDPSGFVVGLVSTSWRQLLLD